MKTKVGTVANGREMTPNEKFKFLQIAREKFNTEPYRYSGFCAVFDYLLENYTLDGVNPFLDIAYPELRVERGTSDDSWEFYYAGFWFYDHNERLGVIEKLLTRLTPTDGPETT